jgi:hypothetical protein
MLGRVRFNERFQNGLECCSQIRSDCQPHRQFMQSGKRVDLDGKPWLVHSVLEMAADNQTRR